MSTSSKHANLLLGLVAFFIPLAVLFISKSSNRHRNIKRAVPNDKISSNSKSDDTSKVTKPTKIKVIYGSTSGTAKTFAYSLFSQLNKENNKQHSHHLLDITIINADEYNEDKLDSEDIVFLIVSTYTDGKPPAAAARMMEWLIDMINDFRVNKNHLQNLRFGIFGLGGAIYNENYGRAVRIYC